MYPTLTIGGLEISLYVLARQIAIVVMVVGVWLRLRRRSWPVTTRIVFFEGLPWLVLGLMVGAVLEAAIPHLLLGAAQGIPFRLREIRWLGALGGASLAGYLYCRRKGLPAGRAFDLFAVPLPLALAVARVGCLLQGCCYGRETTAWPALLLPDANGIWANRYPTQLADILANLFIFVLVAAFERYTLKVKAAGWPFGGFLFLLFAALHLGQRFVFEFWRVDPLPLAGPLHWPHLWCALGLGLVGWSFVRGVKEM